MIMVNIDLFSCAVCDCGKMIDLSDISLTDEGVLIGEYECKDCEVIIELAYDVKFNVLEAVAILEED